MKVIAIHKRPNYKLVEIYLPRTIISQINAIADLKKESFDDAFEECVRVGVTFGSPGYILQSESLKIQVVDNMISQIYPLMNLSTVTVDPLIKGKLVQLYSLSSPILYKNNTLFSDRQKELFAMQIHAIYKYCEKTFKEEFNEFKCWVFGSSRTKTTKALFKFTGDENDTKTSSNRIEKTTEGKYKKDDGSFGSCKIEFPPIADMIKKHMQQDK